MSEAASPGSIEPAARNGSGGFNPITAILVGGAIAAVPLPVARNTYFGYRCHRRKSKKRRTLLASLRGATDHSVSNS